MDFDGGEEAGDNLFPADDGISSPHAVLLAGAISQLFGWLFPVLLLYWSSPVIALGVATTICLYVARLAWDRSIKFQSIGWKLSFAIISICNLLLPFLFVWLLER